MSDHQEPMIKIDGVSKQFVLPNERASSLKDYIVHPSRLIAGSSIQDALKNIDLEIAEGEFLGIVGRNGSGKSTLLKILAGIYQPTDGRVRVRGKLVPFIELGVGFNPELTGRENVFLNAALFGFSEAETDAMYNDIVRFAELKPFMDQKLKNYSSGMQVRLAFSIAIQAEAQVLLLDEVLAVGDQAFQRKCFNYFRRLKKEKTTVVFVTHDMSAVKEYCDRAIVIEKGVVQFDGDPFAAADKYFELFADEDTKSRSSSKGERLGSREMTFTAAEVETKRDRTAPITITTKVKCDKDTERPVFGFALKSASGQHLLGTNTKIIDQPVRDYKAGDTATITWQLPPMLSDGEYSLDVAIARMSGDEPIERWNDAVTFSVYRKDKTPYPVNPIVEVEIT